VIRCDITTTAAGLPHSTRQVPRQNCAIARHHYKQIVIVTSTVARAPQNVFGTLFRGFRSQNTVRPAISHMLVNKIITRCFLPVPDTARPARVVFHACWSRKPHLARVVFTVVNTVSRDNIERSRILRVGTEMYYSLVARSRAIATHTHKKIGKNNDIVQRN